MATHAPITGAPTRVPESCNPYLHSYRAPVLLEIEAFLREGFMSATKLGTLALGDPRFVHDLRNGRDPRSATIAIVRRFMAWYREGC